MRADAVRAYCQKFFSGQPACAALALVNIRFVLLITQRTTLFIKAIFCESFILQNSSSGRTILHISSELCCLFGYCSARPSSLDQHHHRFRPSDTVFFIEPESVFSTPKQGQSVAIPMFMEIAITA
jgi:hypothetical protein